MLAPLIKGEAYHVAHVAGLGLRGTPDADLLAAICAGGVRGVLVTADRAVRRRRHE